MLQKSYGSECLLRTRVFEWYKMFKDGREVFEDEERSGRPSTVNTEENIKQIKDVVLAYPGLSIRDISGVIGISKDSERSPGSDT